MLKKIIDKRNYIILFIIIILIIFIIFNLSTKVKEHMKSFYYFSETITIKIYSSKNMDKTFKEIDNIYKKYNEYYKNPNNNDNKELIEILKYGKKLYKETNGLIDITTKELIKSIESDKDYNFKTTINDLNFKDKSTLKNINLDSIIGSYATTKIEDYLKKEKINDYIINEDGNIVAGNHYDKEKYSISINNQLGEVVDIAYIENQSMVTKGNVNTFKTYMVNPLTSKKQEDNKMVVVIANDLNEANMIANTLYLMDIESGEKFIKQYNAQVYWYTNDGKTKMTKGFQKYLKDKS